MVKPCLYTKYKTLALMMAVSLVLACQVGGSPEPWEVEAVVSHDPTTALQPSNRVTPCLKKSQTKHHNIKKIDTEAEAER